MAVFEALPFPGNSQFSKCARRLRGCWGQSIFSSLQMQTTPMIRLFSRQKNNGDAELGLFVLYQLDLRTYPCLTHWGLLTHICVDELDQVMVCRMFGAKSSPEPVLNYYKFCLCDQYLMKPHKRNFLPRIQLGCFIYNICRPFLCRDWYGKRSPYLNFLGLIDIATITT